MSWDLLVLLLAFQVKHFLADFPLQGWPWTMFMFGKFREKGWALPLAGHAGVHAILTFVIIVLWSGFGLWWLALVDFVAHFTMDRIKASPYLLGRWKPCSGSDIHQYVWARDHDVKGSPVWTTTRQKVRHNAFFWWAIGFDQLVHHLTHYGIIWVLLA